MYCARCLLNDFSNFPYHVSDLGVSILKMMIAFTNHLRIIYIFVMVLRTPRSHSNNISGSLQKNKSPMKENSSEPTCHHSIVRTSKHILILLIHPQSLCKVTLVS